MIRNDGEMENRRKDPVLPMRSVILAIEDESLASCHIRERDRSRNSPPMRHRLGTRYGRTSLAFAVGELGAIDEDPDCLAPVGSPSSAMIDERLPFPLSFPDQTCPNLVGPRFWKWRQSLMF
jgi:hypothetical protein